MKSDGINIPISEVNIYKFPKEIKKALNLIIDKKGENIILMDIKGLSNMADYIIICTGRSSVHNRAISDWILTDLKKTLKITNYHVEGSNSNEWVLMDYIDFIIHIMLPEKREKYLLEKLWMDAKRYNVITD